MSGSGKRSKGQRPGQSAPPSNTLYERYKDALRRGHVAALRNRNDAAVDAYGEAAQIAPDRALPHVSIGGILVKMSRLDDALASYERAIALAPRDEGAVRGLADVHTRLGRRADAAEDLDRLADALEAAGRLADATDAARRALELAESRSRRQHVEALAGRLRAASAGDDATRKALDAALQLLEPAGAGTEAETQTAPNAVELEPGSEGAPDTEVEADADIGATPPDESPAGRPDGAADAAEVDEPAGLGIALGALAETALHAGDPAALDHLLAAARAHRRAGRTAAALDACDLAIGVGPSDVDLHVLLAELYLDRGWRGLAVDKVLLLGRLADLDDDETARARLRSLVEERLADEPKVAQLLG